MIRQAAAPAASKTRVAGEEVFDDHLAGRFLDPDGVAGEEKRHVVDGREIARAIHDREPLHIDKKEADGAEEEQGSDGIGERVRRNEA